MKIERITENKIKVTLTKFDLMSFDIDVDAMTFSPEKVEEIFQNMFRVAEIEEGFIPYDSQLIIEARPCHQEDCELIMYITRLDGPSPVPNALPKTIKNARLKVRKKTESAEQTQLVYSFQSFDDTVVCAKAIRRPEDVCSALHRLRDRYYLIISGSRDVLGELELTLCEYGRKVRAPHFAAVLCEHGFPLIHENAFEKLATYFS